MAREIGDEEWKNGDHTSRQLKHALGAWEASGMTEEEFFRIAEKLLEVENQIIPECCETLARLVDVPKDEQDQWLSGGVKIRPADNFYDWNPRINEFVVSYTTYQIAVGVGETFRKKIRELLGWPESASVSLEKSVYTAARLNCLKIINRKSLRKSLIDRIPS